MAACFARAPTTRYRSCGTALTGELLDAFEPGTLLGFGNVEPGGVRVDHAGLLDGAPGVALALLGATSAAGTPGDRLFLLA